MLRADLHCHTCYSPDSTSSLPDIVRHCQRVGVTCLAVTDHNCLRGALEMQELAPFAIIPGEEIRTSQGEIIGLFLHQEIPPGLSAPETVARIKAQGGLVYIPHPFAWRSARLKRRALESILPSVDVVEVFNARNLFRAPNRRAEAFALKHGLAMGAGSDAHRLRELGTAGVDLPEYDGPQGFLDSLAQGRIIKRYSPIWVHFFTVWRRLRRRLGGAG